MPSTRPPSIAKSRAGEEGFGLLEGLVAIAILTGTMVAIFALVGSILSSAYRIGRSNDTAQLTLNALEAMTAVNPMVQESGKIDLGPYTVNWTSEVVTQVTDGTGFPAGISLYQVALYKTDVRIEGRSGLLATFKLRQIGYRRVRDAPSLFTAGAK